MADTPIKGSISDDNVVTAAPDPGLPERGHLPLAPTTTLQQDLTVASQRRVNLIWESTQAAIAIIVVLSTMICGVYAMIYSTLQIPTIMSVAFGTVVGFYFSRTNHAAIGGIGVKPSPPYEGR